MTADELAAKLGEESARELGSAFSRIKHCLGQLSDEQVWWRSSPTQNSIGNLILHLVGNLRQWIVAGLGGVADVRNRPAEFSERRVIPKTELLRNLETVVQQAQAALKQQKAEQLLRRRRIQANDVTGLEAVFDSIPHFRGHTQEIIYRTRQHLGDAYQFAWQPSTPEQGA